MKKLLILTFGILIAFQSQAQLDQLMELECKSYADAVEKHLKNTNHPKRSLKTNTWMNLGEAYLDLAQRCPDDSTSAEKAENAYKKALEIDQAGKGKKVKAIQEKLNSVELSSAYLMQGAAFYNNQNFETAGHYFKRSSDINQQDTTAALYAGIAAQMNENNDEAISYLNRYVTLGGSDPSIFYTISQIYRTQNRYDDAVAILQKGLEVNPGNTDLPNEMVNVYLTSDNIDKAVTLLKTLVKEDPNNIVNLTNLGIIHDTKAQEKARDLSKINDELDSFNTDRLDKKLIAEQNKLEAYEGEIKALEARIKSQPRAAANNRKRLEEVKAERDKIEEGIMEITSEIAEMKKKSSEADGLRAQASEMEKEINSYKSEAVNYYTQVLNLDPDNFDALYSMAVIKFNEAVETKRVVDFMDLATYRLEGKEIENKACAQFTESKPYFERANKVRPDDEIVAETLKNLNQILEQCSK